MRDILQLGYKKAHAHVRFSVIIDLIAFIFYTCVTYFKNHNQTLALRDLWLDNITAVSWDLLKTNKAYL